MPSGGQPQIFAGMLNCPDEMSFGKVHGPAPAAATVKIFNSIANYLGDIVTLQVGYSSYVGVVTRKSYNFLDGITTFNFTDWRDKLHDRHIFAAYNMQDTGGKCWHMFHDDWAIGKTTIVAKDLDQVDFAAAQDTQSLNLLKTSASQKLLSAADILNTIINFYPFSWVAEADAFSVLKLARPMNIDWRGGVKIVEAVQQVLDACGLQFTVRIPYQIHISLKGFSSNALVNAISTGTINFCSIDPDSYEIGQEISDRGRRVLIVGGRNKYQYCFPCKADWNQNFTWQLCYGGWILSALLKKHNLTLLSKIKEMPAQYFDTSPWSENYDMSGMGATPTIRTRMEMTIEEYINKICFKYYLIDFSRVMQSFPMASETFGTAVSVALDKSKPQASFTINLSTGSAPPLIDPPPVVPLYTDSAGTVINTVAQEVHDINWSSMLVDSNKHCYSVLPIADHMVSDSNLRCIIYATSRKIINGMRNPFEDQRYYTPMSKGFSLEISENIVLGQPITYTGRLIFSDPRFIIDSTKAFTDPESIKPDSIIVMLALAGKIFTHEQGDPADQVRLRIQKKDISNLYRSYNSDLEVITLADNFRKNLKDEGVIPAAVPVKAVDLATKIATQMLFHLAINTSGEMSFARSVGLECDGIIDSVSISYSDNGVTEQVSFTNGWLDGESYSAPTELGISAKMKFEEKLALDRLRALAGVAQDNGAVWAGNDPDLFQSQAGLDGPAATAKAFSGGAAKQGTAKIKLTKNSIVDAGTGGLNVSQVLIHGKLKTLAEAEDM